MNEVDDTVAAVSVNVVRRNQLAPVGGGYEKVLFVSREAEARLISKQVGCQAGVQSEEGAFVAQLAVR